MQAPQLYDIALVTAIQKAAQEEPNWERYLTNMVAWETEHPPRELAAGIIDGWEWEAVHCPLSTINKMVGLEFVDLTAKTRSWRSYRLRSLEATRHALADLTVRAVSADEPITDLSDLFAMVVGHEDCKQLLRLALLADRPAHVLLVGPPASGKSLLLGDLGRIPGTYYYSGGTQITRAGLLDLLLQFRPDRLIIDEIDKMRGSDLSVLLGLMESGHVSRLQHGINEQVDLRTKVFAGANDLKAIPDPILSRFAKKSIPAYTRTEFIQVAKALLMRREGMSPMVATFVAETVVQQSTDIRDAVRVARLAGNDPIRAKEVISILWPKGR